MNFDAPKGGDAGLKLETPEQEAERLAADKKLDKVPEPAVVVEDPVVLAAEVTAQGASDAEKANRLAEQIKNGGIGATKGEGGSESAVESPVSKAEIDAEVLKTQGNQEAARGEAEMALAQGDKAGFQAAYTKMLEGKVAEGEARIKELDRSFQSGNFQNRGPSGSPAVKEIYDYQKQAALDQIQRLNEYAIKQVQADPESIIKAEGFDEGADKRALLGKLRDEAEKLRAREMADGSQEGKMYPHAAAKLEGAMMRVLQSQDQELLRVLPQIAKRVVLSPELQKRIADLKV